jgi:Domain of unknown function (DUF4188)
MTETAKSSGVWPEHINAEAFRSNSSFFIGRDRMAFLKSKLSIRTMVGIGMLLSLLPLPKTILIIIAAVMTIPQLIVTLARHYRLLEDPLKKVYPVLPGRYAGEIDGDFCVFHIGATLNAHILNKEAVAVSKAFEAMHKELEADPEKYGFYGSTTYVSVNSGLSGGFTVQYWRSQEHLNAYARGQMGKHFPAMIWSAKHSKVSTNIGLWHESFTVRKGDYEAIYLNCPQV